MRIVFLIHRYVGIGIGILMACWCLSGIVMMYAPYPYLSRGDRVAGLAPIDWERMRGPADRGILPDEATVEAFRLEMAAGSPLLRLTLADGRLSLIDLAKYSRAPPIDSNQAITAAATYASRHEVVPTRAITATLIEFDQWTIGAFRADRPLYRVELQDVLATEVYVSSQTGELVQKTTRIGRFLGWIGAVPHWLYPTILRQNAKLWTQVVNYTSSLGIVLTATGLFIGIRQLRWSSKGKGGIRRYITLSRRVAVAPCAWPLLWHSSSHLGLERTAVDEPLEADGKR